MVGRPTKYDPSYCERLVEHMAEGASVQSFAAEVDVARSTINQWAEDYPAFSEALSRGKAKCAAWWEKTGRKLAASGEGNASMVIFGLKNMGDGDWQEKSQTEHTGKNGGPIRTETHATIDVSGLSTEALRELSKIPVK